VKFLPASLGHEPLVYKEVQEITMSLEPDCYYSLDACKVDVKKPSMLTLREIVKMKQEALEASNKRTEDLRKAISQVLSDMSDKPNFSPAPIKLGLTSRESPAYIDIIQGPKRFVLGIVFWTDGKGRLEYSSTNWDAMASACRESSRFSSIEFSTVRWFNSDMLFRVALEEALQQFTPITELELD
jgi:hypothetical protein